MRSPVQIWVAAPKSRWNQLIPAGFPLLSQLFRRVYFCGFCLTHTVTHTPKCTERIKECQTGSFAFLSGVFVSLTVGLHDLRHEISYCLCRPILLLPSGVGIGAEGEARVVVPKHTADRFHIYAVLEGQGCESVPLWHNKDKSENPCVARSWLFVLILFPPKNDPKMGSTGGDDKRKLHAKDKFPWTKVSGQNQDFLKLFRGAKT